MTTEWYDLSTDEEEKPNLTDEYPAIIEALLALIDEGSVSSETFNFQQEFSSAKEAAILILLKNYSLINRISKYFDVKPSFS